MISLKRLPYAKWMGWMIGSTILADLLRPKFVPVNVESVNRTHEAPAIVSIIHAANSIFLLVPAILLFATRRGNLRISENYIFMSFLMCCIASISLIFKGELANFIYVFFLFSVTLSATLFTANWYCQNEGMHECINGICLVSTLSLMIALGLFEFTNGRLASRAGPTYWGIICIITISFAPVIRSILLRSFIYALSGLILILASARGAMIASMFAIIAQFLLHIRMAAPRRQIYFYMVGVLGVMALPLGAPLLADKLLALSDRERGIGSGATGRAEAWAQAWNLFHDHPFWGIGYRQHEKYITVATSAHQAYLAMLAEMGAVGLTLYLVFLLGGTVRMALRAWKKPNSTNIAAAAFLCAYVIIGFTENMALATGLPLPLTMLFISAYAWSRDPGTRRSSFVAA